MASDDTLTFDQDPPHRPGLTELGGGAKSDHPDPALAPDPVSMLIAADVNQLSRQAEAVGRVVPLARVWVRFAAGTPSIATVQAPGNEVVAASFTVVDNASGDTTISWKTGQGAPAGALPASVGAVAFQTDDTEIDRVRAILTVSGPDPAVQVKTKLGTTGTDANFCVEIM